MGSTRSPRRAGLIAGAGRDVPGRRRGARRAGGPDARLGLGRRVRPLGPIRLHIGAPPEVVFDVIAAPYLGKTPRALRGKLEVLERGSDLVLAAHFTPLGRGLAVSTVETVRFERPHRISFRLVKGPVPYVVERYELQSRDGATDFAYTGELGTDLWRLGAWWGDRVAPSWEQTVATSLEGVRTEAERRASDRHSSRVIARPMKGEVFEFGAPPWRARPGAFAGDQPLDPRDPWVEEFDLAHPGVDGLGLLDRQLKLGQPHHDRVAAFPMPFQAGTATRGCSSMPGPGASGLTGVADRFRTSAASTALAAVCERPYLAQHRDAEAAVGPVRG